MRCSSSGRQAQVFIKIGCQQLHQHRSTILLKLVAHTNNECLLSINRDRPSLCRLYINNSNQILKLRSLHFLQSNNKRNSNSNSNIQRSCKDRWKRKKDNKRKRRGGGRLRRKESNDNKERSRKRIAVGRCRREKLTRLMRAGMGALLGGRIVRFLVRLIRTKINSYI